MTSVFFFSFLLFQIELALSLCLTLFFTALLSLDFHFLPLHPVGLLGLRSNAGSTCLLSRFALSSLGVISAAFFTTVSMAGLNFSSS